MNCEICQNKKGKRVIAGITMCEECFSRIVELRNGDEDRYNFYSSRSNFLSASPRAVDYISAILQQQQPIIEQRKIEQQIIRAEAERVAQVEQEKRDYARSIIGLYEYDVVTILNEGHGRVDKEKMIHILSSYAHDGWKLHTIYSNELGKNAMTLLGLTVNETACEDVLIFERKLNG